MNIQAISTPSFSDTEQRFELSHSAIVHGKSFLKDDLLELYYECNQEGWDGYDASPISIESYESTNLLIDNLPYNVTLPELIPDASGNIDLEWRDKNNKIVLVTFVDDTIVYVSILGENYKIHGREPFNNEIPEQIKKILSTHFPI